MDSPRTNWRIEEDEDGYWSLLYTGDGKTTPIYGFAATFPLEEDARFILARLQSTDPSLSPDQEERCEVPNPGGWTLCGKPCPCPDHEVGE